MGPNLENALAECKGELKADYAQRGKPWSQILGALPEKGLSMRAAKLVDPASGRFTYPVHRRRSKENVDALRAAEGNLDARWAAIDQLVNAKAGALRTHSSAHSRPTIGPSICHSQNSVDSQPTFPVDARALKVFRSIFFYPATTFTPGEIPWNDFLHSMAFVGFAAMKLDGSVWQFQPTKLDVERSIQFHEPHLRGELPLPLRGALGEDSAGLTVGLEGYLSSKRNEATWA
ncbi:hypothetical protein N7492_009271 [Penicillium capsulatum]|uniref:Uncharacterized protein n=1 Tax=Penicillium capsulatum TaxID=69766 RepID=A0A9W9HTM2_9EURO|nr:hypothetical protein N7492_009271 [Penicillium capsulatum]KAJ6106665.1 hypothetical protein N7512_010182 [Penicillium capsulatum]